MNLDPRLKLPLDARTHVGAFVIASRACYTITSFSSRAHAGLLPRVLRPSDAASGGGVCKSREGMIMSNRLYVGNLPFHATEELIAQRFVSCGEVIGANVVIDRDTGRSRGFAFVDMATPSAAQKAISELDGADFEGRSLRVSIAEERRSGRNERGPRRNH